MRIESELTKKFIEDLFVKVGQEDYLTAATYLHSNKGANLSRFFGKMETAQGGF